MTNSIRLIFAAFARARRMAPVLGLLGLFACAPSRALEAQISRGAPSASKDQEEACANIAASVELLHLERRRKQVSELEAEVTTKLSELETRQNDLRALLDRLDAFERKTDDALVGLYSGMKPESAAAQLAQLDDDMAAELMMRLKTKVSSLILGEMDAGRGAALAKKISQMRAAARERKP